ncbi:MAG: rod shape-determining protein MreC [bacterium]|nr:rod shape-determining protein MreC [bacterium]
MRNFLAFLRQFRVILFLALLQGIALTWYFTFLQYPRSQYLTSANAFSGAFYEMQHEITEFIHLKQNNDWLQKKVARLEARQVENLLKIDRENITVNDTLYMVQYVYTPAEVIKSTHTMRNNYFTINIGSVQGVKEGMGVFGINGVVGTIHSVDLHMSTVKTCLTENVNIAAMIEDSGEHGFMKWDGKNPRKGSLTGISNDRKVKKWSNVITRGSAGTFPRGLPIGKVQKTAPIEGKPLWDVTVLFAEDYRRIQRVFVIKNLLLEEQQRLENNINAPK